MTTNPVVESLRFSLPYRALAWKGPARGFGKRTPLAPFSPVFITGGIGDLILGLRVAEALNEKLGDVHVFSKWPEIAKIFSSLPQHEEKELMEEGYDWYIVLNSVALFAFAQNFRGFRRPEQEELFIRHMGFRCSGQWDSFTDNHPNLDNLLAREAVRLGYNRETLTYAYLGLPPPQERTLGDFIAVKRQEKLNLKGVYITVHDGFDSNNFGVARATKTWDLAHWRELIARIKVKYPEQKIIQLGGVASRPIWGVDLCLIGLLSFEESMSILSSSLCHIDGDSGLVHAGQCFGVRSIVMFGPTNAKFFGYKENVNIEPEFCGDCWWLTQDWMGKCPAGFEGPECMTSIKPEKVFDLFCKNFGRYWE